MGVEVVADEGHGVAIDIVSVHQVGHFDRPIDFRAAGAGRRLAEGGEGFNEHNNARGPLAFVLIIDPFRMVLRGRNRHASFTEQLHGLFVHADPRVPGIVGFCIEFQHVFQCVHQKRRQGFPTGPLLL